MKKYISFFILFVGLALIDHSAEAQRPPGPPRPAIPIDGGISFLAAAGLAYGVRKIYLKNKEEQEIL